MRIWAKCFLSVFLLSQSSAELLIQAQEIKDLCMFLLWAKRNKALCALSQNQLDNYFSWLVYSKGGQLVSVWHVEQIQTFYRHNHWKSLPLILYFRGSPSFLCFRVGLPSTTLTSEHTSRGLSFSLCSTAVFPIQSCGVGRGDMPSSSPPFLSLCHLLLRHGSLHHRIAPCLTSASRKPPSSPLAPSHPLFTHPSQLLHTSRAINSGNVLVLKACKTESSVSAERTPILSSTKMGHLVKNPIKHIPHKVGLFGYFSFSLASLKGYYSFKVPHITPLSQCQCLTVSYLIAPIHYPRVPQHSVSFAVLQHLDWMWLNVSNQQSGLWVHNPSSLNESYAVCCLH